MKRKLEFVLYKFCLMEASKVIVMVLFCFVLLWFGLVCWFFFTLKCNIVCFTLMLCFSHTLSLKVDNYTGCGLIS